MCSRGDSTPATRGFYLGEYESDRRPRKLDMHLYTPRLIFEGRATRRFVELMTQTILRSIFLVVVSTRYLPVTRRRIYAGRLYTSAIYAASSSAANGSSNVDPLIPKMESGRLRYQPAQSVLAWLVSQLHDSSLVLLTVADFESSEPISPCYRCHRHR